MARIVKADVEGALAETVAVLKRGGLVGYPSDTVYGLGAAAGDARAVERVFAVKGRGTEKALSLLLADPADLPGDYKKSKCLAERLALKLCHEGLPLVVVNPTTPIGPYDVKPTPTGRVIVDFLNRKMPACVDAGLNVVAVEDVAKGHVLAMEKGRIGERYVLGNRNMTLIEIFRMLENLTGIRAPRFKIPLWTALAAACADEFFTGRVLKRKPHIPIAAVRAARKYRHFDCSGVVKELGLPQTPVEDAFEKAIMWFRQNGYVRNQ